MDGNILDFLTSQITNNGVFFALFLYMFITGKNESKAREVQLYGELHASQSLLGKMADKYDLIASKIDAIQVKLTNKGD